jgi:uracil-DNA glycosylase family protein
MAEARKASTGTAADFFPTRLSLRSLTGAAAGCKACELWKRGTQTVFGEGARSSRLMLVGEQPGDEEDLAGRPFVGPAGRLLARALDAAGIDRGAAYVTNVVKNFQWAATGRRRLHAKPNAREIGACLPWLEAEIELVRPRVLVCLGATAAQALLGRDFRVSRRRGEFVESELAPFVTATVHPSAILRSRTDEDRQRELGLFVGDLRKVREVLETGQPEVPHSSRK